MVNSRWLLVFERFNSSKLAFKLAFACELVKISCIGVNYVNCFQNFTFFSLSNSLLDILLTSQFAWTRATVVLNLSSSWTVSKLAEAYADSSHS